MGRERDLLDLIVQMAPPRYRRLRANCCEFHGFISDRELDRHAASILEVVATEEAKRAERLTRAVTRQREATA